VKSKGLQKKNLVQCWEEGDAYILFPLQARPCLTLLQSHPHPAPLSHGSNHPWPSESSCRPENTRDSMSFGWFLRSKLNSCHTHRKRSSPDALWQRDKIERAKGTEGQSTVGMQVWIEKTSPWHTLIQRVKPVTQHDCVWGWCVKAAAF
jgi:hypothetical protein